MLGAEDPSLWSFYNRGRVENGLDETRRGRRARHASRMAARAKWTSRPKANCCSRSPRRQAASARSPRSENRPDHVGGVPDCPEQRGQGDPDDPVLLCRAALWRPDGQPEQADRADVRRWPRPGLDAANSRYFEAVQVPAAFFVVGKQAEENPDLVRRMCDEGHEIGNHSWDHPDMFAAVAGSAAGWNSRLPSA